MQLLGPFRRKVFHAIDSHLPKLRGKGVKSEVNFTDPSSGERLGLFDHPKPGTKIMPLSKPTLVEVRNVCREVTCPINLFMCMEVAHTR